jgi:hypothetical protein
MATMHNLTDPRLIRANIALFQGKRRETRRLLDEYLAEQPDETRAPVILWLNAQAQHTHDDRLQALQQLIDSTPPEDVYHQMASGFVRDERDFAGKLAQPTGRQRRILGLRLWQLAGVLVLIGLVTVAMVLLTSGALNPAGEEPVDLTTATPASIAAEVTPTPEQNPLREVTSSRAEYPESVPIGEIQVIGIDADITSVVDGQGAALQAATGAKFYGLHLEFTCRQTMCNSVPEAQLCVGFTLQRLRGICATAGLLRAGDQTLLDQRAALGSAVQGWVIFEIPEQLVPNRLLILLPGEDEPQEVVLEIPA